MIIVTCVVSFIVYKHKKNQRNTSREDHHPCSISDSTTPRPYRQSSAADIVTSQVTEPANDGEPEYVSITTVTLPQGTTDPNTPTNNDTNMIHNMPRVSNNTMNVPMTHNEAYGILAVPNTYEDEYYEHYYY